MTAVSFETSLEIRYTSHLALPAEKKKKAFKINKYPICCHPSEFSNHFCFLGVCLTVRACVSGGAGVSGVPWQIFSDTVDFSNPFCWPLW